MRFYKNGTICVTGSPISIAYFQKLVQLLVSTSQGFKSTSFTPSMAALSRNEITLQLFMQTTFIIVLGTHGPSAAGPFATAPLHSRQYLAMTKLE